jgi:hypothetical protein
VHAHSSRRSLQGGWNDEVSYGAREVGKPAFIVVTSSPPKSVRLTGLDWTVVTTGVHVALAAVLLDALTIHLAPVVLRQSPVGPGPPSAGPARWVHR